MRPARAPVTAKAPAAAAQPEEGPPGGGRVGGTGLRPAAVRPAGRRAAAARGSRWPVRADPQQPEQRDHAGGHGQQRGDDGQRHRGQRVPGAGQMPGEAERGEPGHRRPSGRSQAGRPEGGADQQRHDHDADDQRRLVGGAQHADGGPGHAPARLADEQVADAADQRLVALAEAGDELAHPEGHAGAGRAGQRAWPRVGWTVPPGTSGGCGTGPRGHRRTRAGICRDGCRFTGCLRCQIRAEIPAHTPRNRCRRSAAFIRPDPARRARAALGVSPGRGRRRRRREVGDRLPAVVDGEGDPLVGGGHVLDVVRLVDGESGRSAGSWSAWR